MASLFPDDLPTDRPADRPSAPRSATGPVFRKFATKSRPKVTDAELPPLQPGWVLAHCDGGSRGNPGPAGFGAVLSDAEGEEIAELSEFLGMRTNNYAEYAGLLASLQYALDHNIPKLRVVADSELMVKQIQGKYKVNSPDLKPLHEEARRRIARLEGFQILHALRHKNKNADRLANEAMDRGMGKNRPAAISSTPPAVARATPYPTPGGTPPAPASFGGLQVAEAPRTPDRMPAPDRMESRVVRGFVRDGVIHPLGGARLPEGTFVKIVPE